ncbi:MFS transporter [Streptomyces sp. ST2-7A]|uniref:MFS transporter n=1 Tax=Streptomyces sp. ST2-7A TaxID=2907214 RepID=UPI001F327439|nr:MFS transporter [Streptomyces sp. ST2-7A]MCE7082534.1 MFS transporter [Streptomyces sp. ST2-7A]
MSHVEAGADVAARPTGTPGRPDTATPEHPPGGVLSAPYRALTLGSVSVILLIAFEAMAVGTAMPAAAAQLDGLGLYAFAFAAFFTTSLLGMVLSGQWCDRTGPVAPVVTGIGIFCGGLLLAGGAQTMFMLILGRAGQGFGSGLIIVALYVVVRRAYPDHLRPSALAAFASAWVVPAMVGPVISGTITERFGWRWVFLGITVLVLLPLLVMLPAMRRSASGPTEDGPRGRFDGRGLRLAGAIAIGAALLQFGGQELRWWSLVPAVIGAALLVPSAVRLLPTGTFRSARGMPSAILLRGIVSASFLSAESFVPLLLVTQRGLSYTQAGLAIAAGGLTWALGSFTQSRPAAEPHRLPLMRVGTVLVPIGVAGTALVLLEAVPVWLPVITLALACYGMGLIISSVGVLILRFSEPAQVGGNISSLQVCDALANVVTLTVVGSAFAALGGSTAALAEGERAADAQIAPGAFLVVYVVTTLMALAAIPVAGRLIPRDAPKRDAVPAAGVDAARAGDTGADGPATEGPAAGDTGRAEADSDGVTVVRDATGRSTPPGPAPGPIPPVD